MIFLNRSTAQLESDSAKVVETSSLSAASLRAEEGCVSSKGCSRLLKSRKDPPLSCRDGYEFAFGCSLMRGKNQVMSPTKGKNEQTT